MEFDRRQLLAASLMGGVTSIVPNWAFGSPLPKTHLIDDDEYFELLDLAGDRSSRFATDVPDSRGNLENECTIIEGKVGAADPRQWQEHTKKPEASPAWAKKSESNDYAHLSKFDLPDGTVFSLTSSDLAQLAKRNAFYLFDQNSTVLIGLRGCSIADGSDDTGWSKSANLKITTPDHLDYRCVLGAWDRDQDRIRFFTGSTVPHASSMFYQYHCIPGRGCNLLPTGLYFYEVGCHRASSAHRRQVGCLRIQGTAFPKEDGSPKISSKIFVLRTFDDLVFRTSSAKEYWDVQPAPLVADNIHSSVYYDPGGLATWRGDKFNSAGCQIVKGCYEITDNKKKTFKPVPIGPWAEFRYSAGLMKKPEMVTSTKTEDDGTQYQYMLLTGLEAALMANKNTAFLQNYNIVRYGSYGDPVREVQCKIKETCGDAVEMDGKFGAGSMRALFKHQYLTLGPNNETLIAAPGYL